MEGITTKNQNNAYLNSKETQRKFRLLPSLSNYYKAGVEIGTLKQEAIAYSPARSSRWVSQGDVR